jgi:hypothetical protein
MIEAFFALFLVEKSFASVLESENSDVVQTYPLASEMA